MSDVKIKELDKSLVHQANNNSMSVTLTGKSPTELDTALKTLETIAKTTTLYNGDSAPEAEKSVTSEPKQEAPVVSTADKKAPPRSR